MKPHILSHRWRLSNGMTVLYRQDPEFPLASASLLFRVGSRCEHQREAGLSSMTLDLLMQGTRRKNARTIARLMESVGASLGTQGHEDYSELGFIVPAKELDRALGLTAEILQEPSFPDEEVAKEKAHVLAALASRKDAIFNLAYDTLSEAVYGEHPYGRPLEGRAESVRAFGRRDFRRWHQEGLIPEGAVISVTGPLPPALLLKKIQSSLGRWRSSTREGRLASSVMAAPRLKAPVDKAVPSPFEQAYLMTAWQAPATGDPDQIPLKVLNTLLGGGMSSRLFAVLREELGLAYEVSSFYPSRFDGSLWVIYLGLPKDKIRLAKQRLEALLEELAARGPLESEMRQAKAMIRGAFLMDLQSRRRKGWYSAWWEFLGRGQAYGEEFLERVDSVSATTLKALMRRFLEKPRVNVRVLPR